MLNTSGSQARLCLWFLTSKMSDLSWMQVGNYYGVQRRFKKIFETWASYLQAVEWASLTAVPCRQGVVRDEHPYLAGAQDPDLSCTLSINELSEKHHATASQSWKPRRLQGRRQGPADQASLSNRRLCVGARSSDQLCHLPSHWAWLQVWGQLLPVLWGVGSGSEAIQPRGKSVYLHTHAKHTLPLTLNQELEAAMPVLSLKKWVEKEREKMCLQHYSGSLCNPFSISCVKIQIAVVGLLETAFCLRKFCPAHVEGSTSFPRPLRGLAVQRLYHMPGPLRHAMSLLWLWSRHVVRCSGFL